MHQIWYNSGGNDCSMTSGQWYWIFVKIHMCQCKSVVHFLPPYMPFDGSGTSTDTQLSPLMLCHLLASHLDIIAVANMVSFRPCFLFILICIAIINHAHSNNDRKANTHLYLILLPLIRHFFN